MILMRVGELGVSVYLLYVYINIHEFSILKNVLYTGILRSTVSGLGSFFNLD